MNQSDTEIALNKALQDRILVLDGAMGTMIQSKKLSDADFRGNRFADHPHELSGNNDLLTLTQPEIIKEIHRAYLDAGSDIVETNTFNATKSSQADYYLQEITYELNFEAAKLARDACNDATEQTPGRPRFVAGVLGQRVKLHRFLLT